MIYLPLDPFKHPVKIETREQYIFAVKMLQYMQTEQFGFLFRPIMKQRGIKDEQINEYFANTKIEFQKAVEEYEQNQATL